VDNARGCVKPRLAKPRRSRSPLAGQACTANCRLVPSILFETGLGRGGGGGDHRGRTDEDMDRGLALCGGEALGVQIAMAISAAGIPRNLLTGIALDTIKSTDPL